MMFSNHLRIELLPEDLLDGTLLHSTALQCCRMGMNARINIFELTDSFTGIHDDMQNGNFRTFIKFGEGSFCLATGGDIVGKRSPEKKSGLLEDKRKTSHIKLIAGTQTSMNQLPKFGGKGLMQGGNDSGKQSCALLLESVSNGCGHFSGDTSYCC